MWCPRRRSINTIITQCKTCIVRGFRIWINLIFVGRLLYHDDVMTWKYFSALQTLCERWPVFCKYIGESLLCIPFVIILLQWRHNGRDSVSNHQPDDCLLNRLFRRRSKKTSKLCVTGRGPVNSPYKWPVTRKMFPFDDVILSAV